MTLRNSIVRHRLAALIACTLTTTILPLSVHAEYGIPAGSGAVVTAGQPLLVRATPGWDAEISYEIADGSYVTVWNVAQSAPDGSLWYPIDGGFVPVDAVTSQGAVEGGFALYQDAAPAAAPAEGWVDPATGAWVEPAPVEGWVDPATGAWVEPAAVATAPVEGWVDPATGAWVDPAAAGGWVDPATGQWVEAAPVEEAWVKPAPVAEEWVEPAPAEGWVDPATGQWVEPAAVEGWVDPATGAWVEPAETEGWIDPATGQWVTAAQVAPVEAAPVAAAPVAGWVDPATGQWVEPALAAVAPAEGWVDPATGAWVEPAPVDAVAAPAPVAELAQPAAAATVSYGGVEPWGEPIATAYITGTSGDGAACRSGAERGMDKLAVLAEGEAIEVRGEAVGEWQPVNCAGVGGYVNTSLISWEPSGSFVELEQRRRDRNRGGGDGGDGGEAAAPAPSASGIGSSIASFAQQYVGYPYAYAGEGPYAFDCSGFTKFVVQNTLGMDITHDMFTQIGMGQPVGMGELQPGDLVFFANTFRPGLSHAGIYIGGGQFVHAENESTGVRVSDLNSDYYGSRWAGGTRLA